ncbi:MAG: phosphodiester glycosidase family protein, partial [Cyanothece sp. SIO2G6]|nr:phosphodiester glycosidase family protein [Cyanothece sp. SIO2G6]
TTGQTLWLVIVDGKQPHYSEGMLLTELALLFESLGAEAAIALDGGGSSTLVIDHGSGPTLLNAPIQAKWPMTQRPIANHLGFKALPLTP